MAEHLTGIELVRHLVLTDQWHASCKVAKCLVACEYDPEDIVECIRNGKQDKKEKDDFNEAVDGWKYTIIGQSVAGYDFYIAGKIKCDDQGELFFVITAHRTR